MYRKIKMVFTLFLGMTIFLSVSCKQIESPAASIQDESAVSEKPHSSVNSGSLPLATSSDRPDVSSETYSDMDIPSYIPATSKEIQMDLEKFKNDLEKAKNTSIDKLVYSYGIHEGSGVTFRYVKVFDKEKIKEWIEQVEKFEIYAEPYNPTVGSLGFGLSLYSGDSIILSGGGFLDGRIYLSSNTSVNLRIKNFKEVESKLLSLAHEYEQMEWSSTAK